jgi:hypothetical protein
MNANTDPAILELEEIQTKPAAQSENLPATVAENSPAALMMRALERGASPEQIGQMMDLQERWERREAEKAFNEAMAAFKGEAVEIIKRKRVHFKTEKGVTDYKHAELADVIEAAAPALSRHGFSWSWQMKQANGFMEVTCILKHRLGHSESATLTGPYDKSGGKNDVQAIISTKTYLERHTLKAICGLAEKGEDDDGAGGAKEALVDTWVKRANEAQTYEETTKISREGTDAFNKAKDVEGYRQFAAALQQRRNVLKKEAKNA